MVELFKFKKNSIKCILPLVSASPQTYIFFLLLLKQFFPSHFVSLGSLITSILYTNMYIGHLCPYLTRWICPFISQGIIYISSSLNLPNSLKLSVLIFFLLTNFKSIFFKQVTSKFHLDCRPSQCLFFCAGRIFWRKILRRTMESKCNKNLWNLKEFCQIVLKS